MARYMEGNRLVVDGETFSSNVTPGFASNTTFRNCTFLGEEEDVD